MLSNAIPIKNAPRPPIAHKGNGPSVLCADKGTIGDSWSVATLLDPPGPTITEASG